MNFLASMLNLWQKTKSTIIYRYGTRLQQLEANGVTGMPEKIATVFTCCKVLSDNLSRMPLTVIKDTDAGRQEMTFHRLTWLLKYKPNSYQNPQNFWSTIEYHRNYYGNGFALIYKNNDGYPVELQIIHPGYIKEYKLGNGFLKYVVINPDTQREMIIDSADMLHFRGLSEDGVIGLSPLVAIERQTNINERATATIDNFYKNNATSPMVLETALPGNLSGPGLQAMTSTKEDFQEKYAGPQNAGRWIHLPVGVTAKSIAMQFADARLIETINATRQDISAAYGIPLFMVDGTAEKLNVEQLTTLFKNNTMGPITAIYISEINSKLLTRFEMENGFTVSFDIMSLIGMDYKTLVEGVKEQVVNGLMTPNEGARKLGNKTIPGKYGNMHFMQAQYIALEEYEKANPLLKNDPTLKTNNTQPNNNDSNDNKE